MIPRQRILDVYRVLQHDAGGVFLADHREIACLTAEALGLTYEEVRSVILDEAALWG